MIAAPRHRSIGTRLCMLYIVSEYCHYMVPTWRSGAASGQPATHTPPSGCHPPMSGHDPGRAMHFFLAVLRWLGPDARMPPRPRRWPCGHHAESNDEELQYSGGETDVDRGRVEMDCRRPTTHRHSD